MLLSCSGLKTLVKLEMARCTVPLDGVWQIAEGGMESPPAGFDRTIPVPGLVSLARPCFVEAGRVVKDRDSQAQKDPRRDAFWYRRTFRLEGPVPAVATLRVGKAMFGARVILNGLVQGDHLPCFTPGVFDVRSALRAGENELLIRVGADRDAVPRGVPSGFDYEKTRYIPGIFDSVELILSGTPHVLNAQAAPDIEAKAVRVQAPVRNAGPGAATATPRFTVREAKSGRIAGQATSAPLALEKGEEKTVDARISIANCHLWSPEDPFLYSLEVDIGADRFETRFGMREFRLDPATGRAILNGKPYFMRGSNITLYRFFEDETCKDLPWREDWVRRLHRKVKEMHWNSLRYCIGFPPEAWYRIADEEGILIQDEFPIWNMGPKPGDFDAAELTREYTEWMRERWNHPCVVIWDASNETAAAETGTAIREVRGLDLSNRPWDNGWSAAVDKADVSEQHPYHFQNANYKLRDIAKDAGTLGWEPGKNPIIINEYGWLWLNRDGTPTTLTRDLYQNLLGPDSTTEQRRRLYARYLAAETEFWRSHRRFAAVMHFTALGYSRPDGQTSDHWMNVGRLAWEPEFVKYVRDSFAPVGLMVDYWGERVVGGRKVRVPVVVINDLDKPWSGPVILRVKRGGRDVVQTRPDCRLGALGTATVEFDVTWPEQTGPFTLEAEVRGAEGKPVRSVREIEVIDPGAQGLAFQKSASASSVHDKAYAASNAVDGDPATYWSSTFGDPAWLAVDLGELRKVGRVRITWETAHAKTFGVQVSADGRNWTDVYQTEDGKGGVSEIRFARVETRHVRVYGTKRATEWGYAIRDLQVFE